MRVRTRKSLDRAIFKRTASKVARANLSGQLVPRGGFRL